MKWTVVCLAGSMLAFAGCDSDVVRFDPQTAPRANDAGLAVVLERFRFSRAADFVHMALGEHGVKPGGELAAPVEIFEERFSAAVGFAAARLAIGGQAVQVGVERIGEVASVGVPRGGVANDGAGRAIQLGAKLRHEEIPRGWIAQAAGEGQRKIGGVQALEIRVDFLGIGRRARKSPRGAAFQSGLKLLAREIPFRG